MHDLYELKEMLCKELEEYGRKGEIDKTTLEVVDKLAHATKNIGKIIEMCEQEEGYSSMGGGSYDMVYAKDGRNRGNMGGRSYARNRRRGANQYGVYSRDGKDLADQLRDLMQDAPDERTQQEIGRLISKIESM